jgi:DNA-binding LytR/AlgR family response regulator
MKELLGHLPSKQFIQTHRSFAININEVSHWDIDNVYFGNRAVLISRSRKKAVLMHLKANLDKNG